MRWKTRSRRGSRGAARCPALEHSPQVRLRLAPAFGLRVGRRHLPIQHLALHDPVTSSRRPGRSLWASRPPGEDAGPEPARDQAGQPPAGEGSRGAEQEQEAGDVGQEARREQQRTAEQDQCAVADLPGRWAMFLQRQPETPPRNVGPGGAPERPRATTRRAAGSVSATRRSRGRPARSSRSPRAGPQ